MGVEVVTAIRNQECSFFFDKYYGKKMTPIPTTPAVSVEVSGLSEEPKGTPVTTPEPKFNITDHHHSS